MLNRRKPYKPRYMYKEPRFITTPNRREEWQWKKTVYYWWWRCLQLNDSYRRCCDRGGTGRMSRLYKDFGDVFATDFRTWWLADDRGAQLFAEPPAPLSLHELRDASEWNEEWTRDAVMVVAVPLYDTNERLQRKFVNLLRQRKGALRTAIKKESGAVYPIHQKFSVPAIKHMVEVYELWLTRVGNKPTLAQIGKKAGVIIDYDSKPNKKGEEYLEVYDEEKQRNVMAATVSRYVKKAKLLIDNAGKGRFPCYD